jgi:glycosyltransferase involved in cell wall biosynthesis
VRRARNAEDFLIIIPAYNEEGAIAGVIGEIRDLYPDAPILVIDDSSSDATKDFARNAGAFV